MAQSGPRSGCRADSALVVHVGTSKQKGTLTKQCVRSARSTPTAGTKTNDTTETTVGQARPPHSDELRVFSNTSAATASAGYDVLRGSFGARAATVMAAWPTAAVWCSMAVTAAVYWMAAAYWMAYWWFSTRRWLSQFGPVRSTWSRRYTICIPSRRSYGQLLWVTRGNCCSCCQ